ncbi:MAG: hypothetical protein M3384_11285, partial [Acidobacteriota bacterium]|nr:hypothetical protein [Acidobacteriota bacterium]
LNSITGCRIARPNRSPRVSKGALERLKDEGERRKVKPISRLSPFAFRLDTLESALADARASAPVDLHQNQLRFLTFSARLTKTGKTRILTLAK